MAHKDFISRGEGAALMGGVFDGHRWVAEGTWAVEIDDPTHPLNDAFKGKSLKVNEELTVIWYCDYAPGRLDHRAWRILHGPNFPLSS